MTNNPDGFLEGGFFHSPSHFHPASLVQLYGKRAAWEDPSKWVNDTYPWSATSLQQEGQSLLQLRPEDVGYDGYSSSKEGASSKQVSQSDTEGDPLVRHTHSLAAGFSPVTALMLPSSSDFSQSSDAGSQSCSLQGQFP